MSTDRIPAERVDEILAELNRLTNDADDSEIDWWDWLHEVPEFDAEATSAATSQGVVLSDGTELVWRGSVKRWERSGVLA